MGDLKARRPMRRRLGQESKAVGGPGPGPTHPAGPAASGLRPHPSPSRPALHSAHPTAIGPRLRPSVGGQPAGHRPRPEGKISPAAGRTAGAGLQRPKRRALRGPPPPPTPQAKSWVLGREKGYHLGLWFFTCFGLQRAAEAQTQEDQVPRTPLPQPKVRNPTQPPSPKPERRPRREDRHFHPGQGGSCVVRSRAPPTSPQPKGSQMAVVTQPRFRRPGTRAAKYKCVKQLPSLCLMKKEHS